MQLYIGILFFTLSLIIIFTVQITLVKPVPYLHKKSMDIRMFIAFILVCLGGYLILNDQSLKDRDYAYFLKHKYNGNKFSHYACHKEFLDSDGEISFSRFGMINCIEERERHQKEHEEKLIDEEKEKATAEKEKLLIEQEKVKMNFQQ